MTKRRFDSRPLRILAERVIADAAAEVPIPVQERGYLITSLVRQWITYEGNALLLLGDDQLYLKLDQKPQGKFQATLGRGRTGWLKQVGAERKLNPNEFPEILNQLNCCQSVEVVNRDGLPLRLWANPQGRSLHVEPLAQREIPPGTKPDYQKIAASELRRAVGEVLDPDEIDAVACSVAKQWRTYEGHACLFLNPQQQLMLHVTEKDGGGCTVAADFRPVQLDQMLTERGLPPEVHVDVIAQLNLGQDVQYRDRRGVLQRLWHNPKDRVICVRPVQPSPAALSYLHKPLMCPKCTGVFSPWPQGERQRTCPHCGHTVVLP